MLNQDQAEARDDWEFYQDCDGRWSWRNTTDAGASMSVDRFVSFVEVIASAVKHGFQPGISHIVGVRAERRQKPRSPMSTMRLVP